jgi:hypothetical protein
MSFDPFAISTQCTTLLEDAQPVCAVPFVLEWLATAPLADVTREDYRNSVRRLTSIPATSGKVFPLDWAALRADLKAMPFDPQEFGSVKTQAAWVRKVVAAFKGASGEMAAQRERRSRDDGWRHLIGALKEVATSPFDGPSPTLTYNEIIPLFVLANLARRRGHEPHHFTNGLILDVYLHEAVMGQRETVLRGAALLDRIREVDWGDFSAWLPKEPLHFRKPVLAEQSQELPPHLEDELRVMVELASRGEIDPTTGERFGGKVSKPIHFAARKIVMTGLFLLQVPEREPDTIAAFFDYGWLTKILAQWQQWDAADDPRAISATTAVGYFERIAPFLDRNGYDGSGARRLKSQSVWLQDGAEARGRMTPKAERFCRRILKDRTLRVRMMSLHIHWRKRAEAELEKARTKGRYGGQRHIELARQYGTIACFAAIETDGAPIRVDNALNITFGGPDSWLTVPTRREKNARLQIPAACTKNGKPIDVPILHTSRIRGLQTILWFIGTIRPLFPHAKTSAYLFPAVKGAGKPLSYGTFAGWWYPAVSEEDLPDMTPHKLRHAQASILISKRPGDWTLAAIRLGDTEATVRRNYGFIDTERLHILSGEVLTEDL